MKLESEEFPYCQLNETISMSPTGQILSRSLMLNLRNEKPEIVYLNYLKLKQLVNNTGGPEKKEDLSDNKRAGKGQKKNGTCPVCGGFLIEKRGVSKRGFPYAFKGCGNFPNCNHSEPLEAEEHMSYDREIPIEALPF